MENSDVINRFIQKLSAHLQESHNQRTMLEVRLEMANETIESMKGAIEDARQQISELEKEVAGLKAVKEPLTKKG